MKLRALSALVTAIAFTASLSAQTAKPAAPSYPRPLLELNTSYFPFHADGPAIPEDFARRKQDTRDRILLACGLLPLPTRTPLNPVIHGRVERDDYTIDRVFFESFPGFYCTGSLYRPKTPPKDGRMPGILCPHGHWPNGRHMDLGTDSPAVRDQLANGAERFDSAARNPLQARCVQLARMGCAVFLYDMLGYADSVQVADHRSGRREGFIGTEPGTYGLYATAADLRLQSNFGLQTWNGMRAVDFMLSLPGIDPARIGVTGASGGGTQSMILAAIEDRITAAFPCVMVSTGMQGGCTCENADYLRIGQGNIDIAVAAAPRPYGVTSADDWTIELKTKGWPDMRDVWKKLGKPDNVEAHFDIHFKHNYNHVSRGHMYNFFNKHCQLGQKTPVLERDFQFAGKDEVTVWTSEHPAPSDPDIEKKVLKHWSDDNDAQLSAHPEAATRAWELIIARTMPAGTDVSFTLDDKGDRGSYVFGKGTTRFTKDSEEVPVIFFGPKGDAWKGTAVLWLTSQQPTEPDAAMQKLLAAGVAIAVPQLYLPGTEKAPWNPVKAKDQDNHDGPFWSACFTYGYNHPLVVQRVHDAMSTVAMMKNHEKKPQRIILAASGGMAPVAALAAAAMKDVLDGAVIDTEGFRFASLTDVMDKHYVPGAVKYGDLPGVLAQCDKAKLTVLGEGGAAGGEDAVIEAVLKMAR